MSTTTAFGPAVCFIYVGHFPGTGASFKKLETHESEGGKTGGGEGGGCPVAEELSGGCQVKTLTQKHSRKVGRRILAIFFFSQISHVQQ